MQWQNKNGRLHAEIIFKDQTELAEFVLAAAKYSDNVNHHADMEIHYNRLKLSLFTHDEDAITEKDLVLSEKLNEILKSIQL